MKATETTHITLTRLAVLITGVAVEVGRALTTNAEAPDFIGYTHFHSMFTGQAHM